MMPAIHSPSKFSLVMTTIPRTRRSALLHSADLKAALLHSVILWPPSTLGRHPRDYLIRIHDVARLAMDAVRRVDLQLFRGRLGHHLVDVRRAEPLAGIAVLLGADRVTHLGVDEQVHRL